MWLGLLLEKKNRIGKIIHQPSLLKKNPPHLTRPSTNYCSPFSKKKGRFHMKQEQFLQARVVCSVKQWNIKIESPHFYDAIPIGRNSAVILSDGLTIPNSNVISISSRIYSTSKLLLWRTWFYLCTSFSLNANLRTRLVLTG